MPKRDLIYYRDNPSGKLGGAMIHISDCPKCRSGLYRRHAVHLGKATIWIGPFRSIFQLNRYCATRGLASGKPCECISTLAVLSQVDAEWLKSYARSAKR